MSADSKLSIKQLSCFDNAQFEIDIDNFLAKLICQNAGILLIAILRQDILFQRTASTRRTVFVTEELILFDDSI